MPWNAVVEPGRRYVHVICSGSVPAEELQQCFVAALRLLRENGLERCLADCRQLTGGHSIVDLYGIVTLLEDHGVPRTFREALLVPPLDAVARDVAFFETACANRGYQVRSFHRAEEAVEWLCAR